MLLRSLRARERAAEAILSVSDTACSRSLAGSLPDAFALLQTGDAWGMKDADRHLRSSQVCAPDVCVGTHKHAPCHTQKLCSRSCSRLRTYRSRLGRDWLDVG